MGLGGARCLRHVLAESRRTGLETLAFVVVFGILWMSWKHPEALKIGPRISVFPIVHGSGDFAWEVRRVMLQGKFDALAIPLPPSFQSAVEEAVLNLPYPAVVVQSFREYTPAWEEDREDHEHEHEHESYGEEWKQGADDDNLPDFRSSDPDDPLGNDSEMEGEPSDAWEVDLNASYVPIDPCQGIIAAIRTAMGEHIPRFFIDLEVNRYETYQQPAADPYCLKQVSIERFAAAMLPYIERPAETQRQQRILRMAYQLRQLSIDYKNILLVCDFQDWPWIREAYFQPDANPPQDELTDAVRIFGVRRRSLYFLLGELPFITALYEHARMTLADDSELTIDGVKRLLISARKTYERSLGKSARKITPLLLRQCMQYIRNLTLIERRLTPDLFTILQAAQQIGGDTYAYHVLRKSKQYNPAKIEGRDPEVVAAEAEVALNKMFGFDHHNPQSLEGTPDPDKYQKVKMGLGQIELPSREIVGAVNRLSGIPLIWKHLELRPRRDEKKQHDKWMKRWSPGYQCSYPPEDIRIEQFRSTVFNRAKQIMGTDSAKVEKFTTSVMDGIDIRETLRHWYDGDIYVRLNPPVRTGMDAVVMLFDTPADPRQYKWRTTWFAEHEEESTLAFFATDFAKNPIGPGICSATYGGAMFLFPPRRIPEIWQEPAFDFTTTLEERLLAAACFHAEHRNVALLSPVAPGYSWRRIAKLYGKRLIHVPLGQFSDSTVQQLRLVHVLNGMDVRSYASNFIQRP